MRSILIAIVLLSFAQCQKLGGMNKAEKLDSCEEALKKAPIMKHFKSYKLTDCYTQVVNGINLKLALENLTDKKIQKCFYYIYRSFKRIYTVSSSETNELDCEVLYKAEYPAQK